MKEVRKNIEAGICGYVMKNHMLNSEVVAIFAYHRHLVVDEVFAEDFYEYSNFLIREYVKFFSGRTVNRACKSLFEKGIFVIDDLYTGKRKQICQKLCRVKFPESEQSHMSGEYINLLVPLILSAKFIFPEICLLLAFWNYRKFQKKNKYFVMRVLFHDITSCSYQSLYRAFHGLLNRGIFFYENNQIGNMILKVDLNIRKED